MSDKPLGFVPDIDALDNGLRRLDRLALEPQPDAGDDPIFLAGVGWRTGSTLMQRILMTDPSLLMWGEPMGPALIPSRLTEALSGVSDAWPSQDQFYSHRPEVDLTTGWVATLGPDAGHLKAGMRALFDVWLAGPARQRGFKRWGVKEVRWMSHDGLTLRWLYPKSRFVVIVRHPVDSFHSIQQFNLRPGAGLWARWPDRYVDNLEDYAKLWNVMAAGWAAAADRLQARLIRYEDLVAGHVDLAELGAALRLNLKPALALAEKAGANPYYREMTDAERARINTLTLEGRASFGYLE